ncbi:ATP-binding cassette domain-containing protein [Candidatus Stoquefichus sp. SB1]|uniref:ATP-binding cassette domain-containing protein n=1 Tax=Candidatus Stoquefichus sp. SB1 TaxID=1658109 RepID=UPI00067EFB94|nr:ATP-binding cassette domain-containing protein [Candidatus Stoquefichus sp. SB1]
MIKLSDICLSFDNNILIEKSDMDIPYGIVTLLKGESGCGKSSLLMNIGLLSRQANMNYYFDDININKVNEKTLCSMKQSSISFVFQETYLFEHLNLIENIQFYASLSHRNVDNDYIREQLDFVGLDLDFNTRISSMSGGEKQRLAVVCGILKDAKLFIFDEPTAYLDEENKQIIISIIKRLAHEKNKMVLIASHDEVLVNISDQIYEFQNHHIICTKSSDYEEIKTEFIQEPMNIKSLYSYVYHKYIISSVFISIILGIVLSGFTISFIYGYFYENHDEKVLLNNIHHEVYIVKSDETKISAIEQVKLQNVFEEYQLYSYIDFNGNVQFNNKVLENIQIRPSTPHSIDDTHIMKSYSEKNFESIYASYEIYHYFKTDIQNHMKLNNQAIEISGILKPTYNSQPILYLSYDKYKQLLEESHIELGNIPVDKLIIEVNSLNDYSFIKRNIPDDYRFVTDVDIEPQVNMLSFFNSRYLTIIWIVAIIIFIIYKTYRVIDDKKNIALLKTLGVNSKQLMEMKVIEELMTFIPMGIIAFIISNVSMYMLFIEALNMKMIGIVILINVFGMGIVNIIIYYIIIKKYSAASLMKS